MSEAKSKQNFKQLYEASQKLPSAHLSIPRSAEQISESSQKLTEKYNDRITHSQRAKNLLESKGVDVEKMINFIKALDLKQPQEAVEIGKTDIKGFLKYKYEAIILASIEDANKETESRFQEHLNKNLEDDWNAERESLLDALGKAPFQRQAVYSALTSSDAMHISSGEIVPVPSPSNNKTTLYAQKVSEVVEKRMNKENFPIIRNFKDCIKEVERNLVLIDCWTILEKTLQEDDNSEEKMYELPYQTDDKNLQKKFIKGSLSFLQSQYCDYIQRTIREKPTIARVGGAPTNLAKIRAFLNVKAQEKLELFNILEERVDNHPLWAQIFYAIRCGYFDVAQNLANHSRAITGNFSKYLEEYSSRQGLSDDSWSNINKDYRILIRQSRDPYKISVYNLIGRCDKDNNLYPDVIATTPDFIWYRLSMIPTSEESSAVARNYFTLREFQEYIIKIGPNHFSFGGTQPLYYFQVLIMSQQFEKAIHYLLNECEDKSYVSDAVHMGLGLYYYGALRISSDSSSVSRGRTVLPLPQLLKQYSLFLDSGRQVNYGLYYLLLLRDAPTRDAALKSLILTSSNLDNLLGQVFPDGSVLGGHHSKLFTRDDQWRLVKLVCEEFERDGKYEEAIRLYDLCDKRDHVVRLLNSRLSRVVGVQYTNGDRERLLDLAVLAYEKYQLARQLKAAGINHPRDNPFYTLYVLMSLGTFFEAYFNNNYREVLRVIDELGLLPRDPQRVAEKVAAADHLDDAIKVNLADVLLTTMNALHYHFQELGSAGAVQDQMVVSQKASALVQFSGQIKVQLPHDKVSRLLQFERQMRHPTSRNK
eukprot:TRINITY_DN5409_c0_g1_i1.p1 TRINITY_DN5409_c0_g1~~TRINITY_DN5409_c0_g1_i1.p1  ORF type:complete len:818 (-),score=164.56 TRINITY_DN5409_c0_g1_i1:41-2494(-)